MAPRTAAARRRLRVLTRTSRSRVASRARRSHRGCRCPPPDPADAADAGQYGKILLAVAGRDAAGVETMPRALDSARAAARSARRRRSSPSSVPYSTTPPEVASTPPATGRRSSAVQAGFAAAMSQATRAPVRAGRFDPQIGAHIRACSERSWRCAPPYPCTSGSPGCRAAPSPQIGGPPRPGCARPARADIARHDVDVEHFVLPSRMRLPRSTDLVALVGTKASAESNSPLARSIT